MGIGYLLLVLFGGYVALKYYSVKLTVEKKNANRLIAPPGVNFYCDAPATSREAQVLAFQPCNCCSTVEPGFAASVGPTENQPQQIVSLEI
jgi:hypothetical protein